MRATYRVVVLIGAVLLAGGHWAKAQSVLADSSDDGAGEPARLPHPEPRVIVNVLAVRGPHKPDRVQHDVRFGWKRIVRCYKAQGATERAAVMLELVVSGAGNIARARGIVFEPKDSELARCLAGTLPGLAMAKAPGDSTADVDIQLSPGDRPRRK